MKIANTRERAVREDELGYAHNRSEERVASLEAYWKKTVRFTILLLSIWFFVGLIVSIVLAPVLNSWTFLGGPLGFWVAQNGAIYVFWLLVLVYAVRMNRLDREFDVHDLRD